MAQTALALVLLTGSALLFRSYQKMRNVDPGYETRDIFTFRIAPEGEHLDDAASFARFHLAFGERLAQLPGVQAMVVGQGARVLLVGVALGITAAALSTRALRTLLFGVGALDPTTFAAVAGGMVLVGLLAAWLPARRASRVDPIGSLRGE